MPDQDIQALQQMTADIVTAYVSHNAVSAEVLPGLVQIVFGALSGLVRDRSPADPAGAPERVPAVPVRRSVQEDAIICLECGRALATLKRHLRVVHGLDIPTYRARWGLAPDYPMVAPAYSAVRSNQARAANLGRREALPD